MRKVVLASLLILSTVAVAACDESKPTFDVYGQLTGTREPTSVESRCVFPDETVTEGDMVTVRGAANQILATSALKVAQRQYKQANLCDMRFDLRGIPTGEAAYQLTVGTTDPVVTVSQETLQCSDGTFGLAFRGDLQKVWGRDVLSARCVTGSELSDAPS